MNRILSIIIPVYKVEDYVGQCLQSVFDVGADEREYEVVVVNDGTPDKSMDVVRRVCEGHGNVKIVEQANQGLSAARMAGLPEAEGDYVWFVDSDDWLEKGAVDTILKMIAHHSDVSVFAMPLIWIGTKGEHLDYQIDIDQIYNGKELLKTSYPLWAAQRYVIKRDLFHHQALFFPIGLLHEDEYFYRVLLYHAEKVLFMKTSYYYYRQRDNSIMSNKGLRSLYDIVSIYKHLDSILQSEISPDDRVWFQKDINSLLVRNYKDSYCYGEKKEGMVFRKKNSWLLLRRGMGCKAFSIKEKVWIICLLYFPKVIRIRES